MIASEQKRFDGLFHGSLCFSRWGLAGFPEFNQTTQAVISSRNPTAEMAMAGTTKPAKYAAIAPAKNNSATRCAFFLIAMCLRDSQLRG